VKECRGETGGEQAFQVVFAVLGTAQKFQHGNEKRREKAYDKIESLVVFAQILVGWYAEDEEWQF